MMEKKRIKRESDFQNQRLTDRSLRSNRAKRFYSITHSIQERYQQSLMQNCKNTKILEYGCGPGNITISLAKNGASVIGIDISQVALGIATAKAKQEGCEINTEFRLMNAENLEFRDNSFDLVCGSGILHHLELKKALPELRRVLDPEGAAIFIEPLGHNVFLNVFRHFTPSIRSEDEHPLLVKDLALLEQYFGKVHVQHYYLFAFAAVPFRGLPGFNLLLGFLEYIDHLLFKLPFFRQQAWQVLIELSEPKSNL